MHLKRAKKRGKDRIHRLGDHRLERIGGWSSAFDGAGFLDSQWDRLACCIDRVPEDGGGRPPDAPNARQSKDLQADVRQASARSWCANGSGQAQRWVSQVREPESGGHAQSVDDGCQG